MAIGVQAVRLVRPRKLCSPGLRICKHNTMKARLKTLMAFTTIENAISAKRKVSRETWEAEMLCKMPSQEELIYREFDFSLHII
jgi:hypothetical protein